MVTIEPHAPATGMISTGSEFAAIQREYNDKGLSAPVATLGDVTVFNHDDSLPSSFWDTKITLGQGKGLTDKSWKCRPTTIGDFFSQHLFRHARQERKEGSAFLQGELAGKERKSRAMTKSYLMVFDVDNGQKLDDVREVLIRRDMFAFLYTSHSHRKPATKIKKDLLADFIRKELGAEIQLKEEITQDHAREFLIREKGYLQAVLEICELDGWQAGSEGEELVVRHCELDRFRIVLPLAQPFDFLSTLRQADQINRWKDTYAGVGQLLGIHFDRSCIDPARLMYNPAHPEKGEDDWRLEMVMGKPLDLSTVEPVDHKLILDSVHAASPNAFIMAGGENPNRNPIQNKWLVEFRREYGSHLSFADLVRDHYEDGECPRADHHTDTRLGFQCDDGDGQKEFHAYCHHHHCAHFNGDRLAWLDFIVTERNLTRQDLLQYVPDNIQSKREGERRATVETATGTLATMLSALPPPRETSDLPLDETLAILAAAAASKDPADKVRAFEALKPYRRPRKDLETLFEAARKKTSDESAKAEQVERQHDKRDDNKMTAMNDRFGVVKVGGSVKFVDLKDPDGYSFMSKFDFKTLLENQFVMKGEDRRPLADEWLKWSDRKTFAGVEFAPGGGRVGYLNLFTGFPFKPICGGSNVGDGWKLLETHIFENLCHGNVEWYDWLMTWFADIVRNPETKRGSCVIVRGEQGVGKSIVFDLFRELLGGSAVKVDSLERLTGRFNSSLSAKVLAHLDEGVWAGNRAEQSKMKNLITSPSMFIERKGLEGWEEPNFIRVAITSNDRFLMSMTEDDRRNFVLECGKARQNDTLFFKQMVDDMRNGGFEAWMYDLMNWEPDVSLGGWEALRKPPTTPWATEQMALSKRPEDRFFERLKQGEEIDHPHCISCSIQLNHDHETAIRREDLAAQFDAYMSAQKSGRELIDNPTALAKLCEQHFPGLVIKRNRTQGERGRKYIFPALSVEEDIAA